jgi:hypothetical protein
MLHGMSDIGGLDQVLNHNRCLSVDIFLFVDKRRNVRVESLGPSALAEGLELLVEDVRRQNCVNNKLAESIELVGVCIDAISELHETGLHQRLPSKIHRMLFGDALALVGRSE